LSDDLKKLAICHYPDARLRQRCRPVTEFSEKLAALAERMLDLMCAEKGIGLAAPQVGVLRRLFVMSPTGQRKDGLVFVNPVIRDREGNVEAEEGCLSLPGVNVRVRRARRCRIEAQDVHGRPFSMTGEDLLCRIWQHETDHLDGILIIDRMGPADRLAVRKTLRALEESFNGKARHKASAK
jgi:peptide deformylase